VGRNWWQEINLGGVCDMMRVSAEQGAERRATKGSEVHDLADGVDKPCVAHHFPEGRAMTFVFTSTCRAQCLKAPAWEKL
jgi:hypothetical protein